MIGTRQYPTYPDFDHDPSDVRHSTIEDIFFNQMRALTMGVNTNN